MDRRSHYSVALEELHVRDGSGVARRDSMGSYSTRNVIGSSVSRDFHQVGSDVVG